VADKVDDPELQAIATLLSVLEPLKPPARDNVIDFVFRRLGIVMEAKRHLPQDSPVAMREFVVDRVSEITPRDLRSLAEEKKPKTVIQKVALVAYYLANYAPGPERRDFITAADIKRYFKQAGFPLPTGPDSMTLVNAKNAGYLDGLQGGQYRLNPVGHNLVVHKLPSSDEKGPLPRRRVKKKLRLKRVKLKGRSYERGSR
jgi:hypothetical protein